MPEEKLRLADLTERELNKILETEKFLNSKPDHKRGEEIILLAYKKEKH